MQKIRVHDFLFILSLMFSVLGCATSTPPASSAPKMASRIWRDDEMARVLSGYFDGASVDVYRWENGAVEGWVEFDGAEGSTKQPIEIGRQIVETLTKEEGTAPKPEDLFGMIIVKRKRLSAANAPDDDANWYQCSIKMETGYKSKQFDQTRLSTTYEGLIKAAKAEPKPSPSGERDKQSPADSTTERQENIFGVGKSDTSVTFSVGAASGEASELGAKIHSYLQLKFIESKD